ncbi:alpha/beta hydrolase [Actinoplanes sp. NPDC051494]|uniref:alpha/beta hydrolase n=1 Tax=Actinoplanes sp. NPDC051494 TaxID=3363907 RepID=UPI00379BC40F
MTDNVVFIHGLWIHSEAWQPWRELFGEQGYRTYAPGWPGDRDSVADTRLHADGRTVGVEEITDSYAAFIAGLDSPPIVVGHSFGGLIAQKLLSRGLLRAAVAFSPAPIKGIRIIPPSLLRSSFPVLSRPGNKRNVVSLTEKQFAYSFGNALPAAESTELYERIAIPSPGRPLFEASSANFTRNSPTEVDTTRDDRGPLLLVSAGKDHTVPASVVAAAFRLYSTSKARTDIVTYADRGHSAPFDHGWRELADDTLAWLGRQGR